MAQIPDCYAAELSSPSDDIDKIVEMAKALLDKGMVFKVEATDPSHSGTINLQAVKDKLGSSYLQKLDKNLEALGSRVPKELREELMECPAASHSPITSNRR